MAALIGHATIASIIGSFEEPRRRRLILFDQAANCRADRGAARASIRHTSAPISQYQIANGDASATRLKTICGSTSAWTDDGKPQAESTIPYCKVLFGERANPAILNGKTIAIVGYGNQDLSQAINYPAPHII